MTNLPLIITVNTMRMWQVFWFGLPPVCYGPTLQPQPASKKCAGTGRDDYLYLALSKCGRCNGTGTNEFKEAGDSSTTPVR
ncbi:hypothetical protein PsAD2_04652 [Pseudovibrio axinellae]|uniref:Uncharacterized protein n=1 Tax=Pseudovibrio axinellae TaxID=989403 RepID=A0A165SWG6_9HYPH|nr:hypothetical protein [Pseudovibrio axinellae]KZL04569.1 hypothetical protein PsAD2_04652 [Pseudovibrio axinellae]SEQ72738.1 hypothetical protein SAMN05421798_10456 [Pseudovibrio axinellae]